MVNWGFRQFFLILLTVIFSSSASYASCDKILQSLHGVRLQTFLTNNKLSMVKPAKSGVTIDLYDWDDNVFYMTSARIFLLDEETGKEVGITTEAYAKHRNDFGKPDGPYPRQVLFDFIRHTNGSLERITIQKRWEIEHQIGKPGPYQDVKLVEGSWHHFRDVPNPQTFTEQVRKSLADDSRWRAPFWFSFVTSLREQGPQHLVGILTTRGHHPESFTNGIQAINEVAPLPQLPHHQMMFPIYNPKFPSDMGARPHERKAAVILSYLNLLQALPNSEDGTPHRLRFSEDDKGTIEHVRKAIEAGRTEGRWSRVKIELQQTAMGGETSTIFEPIPTPKLNVTEKLRALVPPNSYFIPAVEATKIAAELGLNLEELLVELIPIARELSTSPISQYQVGVAALSENGDIYLGTNLEYPGLPLFATIHGEQFVFTNAFLRRESSLRALALSAEPCGHCRQWMNEANGMENLRILVPGKQPAKLSELLPHAFGPKNLGATSGMLDAAPNKLTVNHEELKDQLKFLAFEAAEISYAPYTQNPAGIAIEMNDGTRLIGSTIENAAFNPALSPIQVAFINMKMSGKDPKDIKRIVLAQVKPEGSSEHSRYARALLDSMGLATPVEVLEISMASK